MSRPNHDIDPAFCRHCLSDVGAEEQCPNCHSPRLIRHAELHELTIAHIDCDAFYAAVEKRDNPELADKPLIIGGGHRGVVSTACYIARIHGVGSAMPMFKALKLCPNATVVRPNMEKYSKAGREIRQLMRDVTPLVEPLSIDEAFLNLTGTERLHGQSPARTLATLVQRIETEVGVTASIGLSHNKFLAKVASDLDKPRGFSLIGRAETLEFLKPRSVSLIWGVGKAFQRKLAKDGIRTIGQLQRSDLKDLVAKYGSMGERLYNLSRGLDHRQVSPHGEAKSISAETTFSRDIKGFRELEKILWTLAEKVSRRAKASGLAGETVVLKLKSVDFKIRTRNRKLTAPTQLADTIFKAARPLLEVEAVGTEFRLIGVGITQLQSDEFADPGNLLDPDAGRRADAEHAMDKLRERFGRDAVVKGLGFGPERT
jgi:DNA polymerase-4